MYRPRMLFSACIVIIVRSLRRAKRPFGVLPGKGGLRLS